MWHDGSSSGSATDGGAGAGSDLVAQRDPADVRRAAVPLTRARFPR